MLSSATRKELMVRGRAQQYLQYKHVYMTIFLGAVSKKRIIHMGNLESTQDEDVSTHAARQLRGPRGGWNQQPKIKMK
jgi:hypothetical protein